MLHDIYPTSLRIVINESYKVVVTSNICSLDRSPNVGVIIIQNPLGAVSRCAKFHHGLLFNDTIFTEI